MQCSLCIHYITHKNFSTFATFLFVVLFARKFYTTQIFVSKINIMISTKTWFSLFSTIRNWNIDCSEREKTLFRNSIDTKHTQFRGITVSFNLPQFFVFDLIMIKSI